MPVSRNDHQAQLFATPFSRTRLVTRLGVSVLNVVATIDTPISHHGAALPEVKNSVVLDPARLASSTAGRNEIGIDNAAMSQSSGVSCISAPSLTSVARASRGPQRGSRVGGPVPPAALSLLDPRDLRRQKTCHLVRLRWPRVENRDRGMMGSHPFDRRGNVVLRVLAALRQHGRDHDDARGTAPRGRLEDVLHAGAAELVEPDEDLGPGRSREAHPQILGSRPEWVVGGGPGPGSHVGLERLVTAPQAGLLL